MHQIRLYQAVDTVGVALVPGADDELVRGELPARIVAQRVHIAHAVDDVVAISPHAVEREVFDGRPVAATLAFHRHMHLNDRSLLDRHIFEGAERHRSRILRRLS